MQIKFYLHPIKAVLKELGRFSIRSNVPEQERIDTSKMVCVL